MKEIIWWEFKVGTWCCTYLLFGEFIQQAITNISFGQKIFLYHGTKLYNLQHNPTLIKKSLHYKYV